MRRHALDPVSLVFGFAFIAAGGLFFAGQLDQAVRLRWLWPVLLLVLGIGILIDLGARREQAAPEPAEAPADARPAAAAAEPDRAVAEPDRAVAEPEPAEPEPAEPEPAEAGAEPGEGDQVEAPAADRTTELGPEGPAERGR
jgi:hypothetical protein